MGARGLLALVLLSGCVESNVLQCELGGQTWVCPAEKLCDPARQGCVTPDQLASCTGMPDGTACALGGNLAGVCATEVCEVSRCGDGLVVAPEQCDGANLGATPSCTVKGFYDDIPAGCRADCTYDYGACTGSCGDNMINGDELCDGTPPSISCVELGYGAGFLACSGVCGPGLGDCKFTQWSNRIAPEQRHDEHGTSDRDVYSVGDGRIVMHYDGATWSEIDITSCTGTTVATHLRGVYSFGGGKAVAVGFQDPFEPIAIDISGTTCTRTGLGAGLGEVRDVWAASPTNVVAVGPGIFTFDGTTWTRVHPELTLWSVWGNAADNVYAAGPSGLWRFTAGSWSKVTGLASTSFLSVTGTSATDIYVLGDAGIEHWMGSSWQSISSPAGTPIALVATADHLFAGTSTAGVLAFDGANWSSLSLPSTLSQTVYGMWAAPSGKLYVNNYFNVLTFSGSVMSSVANALPGTSWRMIAVDPNKAYAHAGTGLYEYDGAQWSQITGGPYNIDTFSDIWRSPTGTLFLAQGAFSGAKLVTYTPAAQNPWATVADIPSTQTLWGTSNTDIWMATEFGGPMRHYSGGSAPDAVCATCTVAKPIIAIWGTSSTNVYAVGASGSIYHYNGSAWSAMTSGTTQDLYSIFGFAANDIFAVGGDVVHFDGTSWSKLAAPPGYPYYRTLWGTAADDLFVVTSQGLYHYDGSQWSPVRTYVDTQVDALDGTGDVVFMHDGAGNFIRLVRTIDW
jgi:hypothetical protein